MLMLALDTKKRMLAYEECKTPRGEVYECQGCYVKFTVRPGQRDALVKHLLRAVARVSEVAGCQVYLINTSPTEPESVWVTEVWRSQQEHDASLTIEGAQEAISQVLPLLASSPKRSTSCQLVEKVWPWHRYSSSECARAGLT
jgi:quinol monooxygenase YgiN